MIEAQQILGGHRFGEVGFEIRRCSGENRIFIMSKIHLNPSGDACWQDEHSSTIRVKDLEEAAIALESAAKALRGF